MKISLIMLLLCLASVFAVGQHQPPMPPKGMIVVRLEDGRLDAREVFVLAVTKNNIAYKLNAGGAQPEVKRMKDVDSIFLYDPADYLEALDLYEDREYEKARHAFIGVKERYGKRFPGIPNNPGVMAGFYELECLRKLNDLEGLRLAHKKFKKDALTSEVALQQLEIYALWDAIRADLNQEAFMIAESYKGKRLPGHQRAQVAYCQGRAMEALKHSDRQILLAYQTAITADAGASEIITRDAILRSLEIIHQNDRAKAAMHPFEQGQKVQGLNLLMEAAGLCAMIENQLAGVEPLPAKYRYFLKFSPEKVEERFKGDG